VPFEALRDQRRFLMASVHRRQVAADLVTSHGAAMLCKLT